MTVSQQQGQQSAGSGGEFKPSLDTPNQASAKEALRDLPEAKESEGPQDLSSQLRFVEDYRQTFRAFNRTLVNKLKPFSTERLVAEAKKYGNWTEDLDERIKSPDRKPTRKELVSAATPNPLRYLPVTPRSAQEVAVELARENQKPAHEQDQSTIELLKAEKAEHETWLHFKHSFPEPAQRHLTSLEKRTPVYRRLVAGNGPVRKYFQNAIAPTPEQRQRRLDEAEKSPHPADREGGDFVQTNGRIIAAGMKFITPEKKAERLRREVNSIYAEADKDNNRELTFEEEEVVNHNHATISELEKISGSDIMDDQMKEEVIQYLESYQLKADAAAMSRGFLKTESMERVINRMEPALRKRQHLLLLGETGGAKSNLAKYMFTEVLGQNPITADCGEGVTYNQLMGSIGFEDGKTVLKPGPVLRSIIENRPLILEEYNSLSPQEIKTLNRLFLAKPGEQITYEGYTFTIPENNTVIATANPADNPERYKGIFELGSDAMGRLVPVRIPYPDQDAPCESYWDDAQALNLPPNLLKLAKSVFTTSNGNFLPNSDPRRAGLTEEQLVRLACAAHVSQELFTHSIDNLAPGLKRHAEGGGMFSPPDFDLHHDSDSELLTKECLSPRNFVRLLNSIKTQARRPEYQGPGGQDLLVNDEIAEFIKGLGDENDQFVMQKVFESFGFVNPSAASPRGDFKMPNLYPEIRQKVERAYAAHEATRLAAQARAARQQQVQQNAATATGIGREAATAYAEFDEPAKEAAASWKALEINAPENLDALYNSVNETQKENLVKHLKSLEESKQKLTRVNTASGVSLGESLNTVLVPVGELLKQVEAGNLHAWTNSMFEKAGLSTLYTPGQSGQVFNANLQAYPDPANPGTKLNIKEYLGKLQTTYGDWMPILTPSISDPAETTTGNLPAERVASGREMLNGVAVDGNFVQLLATVLQQRVPGSPFELIFPNTIIGEDPLAIAASPRGIRLSSVEARERTTSKSFMAISA